MVATFLRGQHTPVDAYEYPHSHLTFWLRGDVVEAETVLQADLAYMLAFSSLYSHERADIEKGSSQVNTMYFDALARTMPYLTGGKTGTEMQQKERMRIVEEYRRMKDAVTKRPEHSKT